MIHDSDWHPMFARLTIAVSHLKASSSDQTNLQNNIVGTGLTPQPSVHAQPLQQCCVETLCEAGHHL